jgi:hypothetical protein
MTIDWRILAALTLALVIAFAVLLVINANLRAEVSIAKSESAALHIDNADFKAKLDRQNRAAEAFKVEASARTRRAAVLTKSAQADAKRHLTIASDLEQEKSDGDNCSATNILLNHYIQALQ